ncbi:YrhK family protein [Actinomycetospora sp. CA-101289]|uniref:YrhK family protein n=1 Tax=Actinomycetospora sp. CA-101289 TaxID=3239893 RepID=UPI003D991FBD
MIIWYYLRYIARHAHDLPWVHLVIGLVGNLFFVLGSIMFLYPASTRLGTWFFIIASWGLLIGVLGEIATRYEARRRVAAAAASAPPA